MGGAKNCPETPRQKMIGMMYLVLTAMLALNVSTDILKGFSMVDRSLRVSIETSEKRNANLYGTLTDMNSLNPGKVGEWLAKSELVKQKADSLYDYIQNYKVETIRLADGSKTDSTGQVINAQDNLDVAGTYAIVQGNGKILREKIEDYREFLKEHFNNDSVKSELYDRIFNTDSQKLKDGSSRNWENGTFESQPLAAVVTMLTKYQNDVRTSETELIQYFISQTDASDFRVNKIEAIVIPESKTVMQGSPYKAQIALVALDSTKQPLYFVNGVQLDTAAKGNLVRSTGSVGSYILDGYIEVIGNDGVAVPYPFTTEYTVTAPSATIANMDMNVVYRGYDNRMGVSVPGVATEKLRVTAEGATMEKKGNEWICKPSANSEVTINVLADMNGKMTSMGSQKFRVRTLPDPTAFLRITDSNGNRIDYLPSGKHKLRRQELIDGTMVAEYADGMLQAAFRISEFTLLISDSRGGFTASQSSGNKFSDSQQRTLLRLKAGSVILIDKIKVTGAKATTLSYPLITLP